MKIGAFTSDVGRSAYVTAYDQALARMPEPVAVADVATAFGTVRAYRWNPPVLRAGAGVHVGYVPIPEAPHVLHPIDPGRYTELFTCWTSPLPG